MNYTLWIVSGHVKDKFKVGSVQKYHASTDPWKKWVFFFFFLLFQKPVLATWIPDMLVLPLDFKLSLTHSHVTEFITEEWWEACGWWPHSHLEISPVSALVSCSYTVTFFFFLMGLLIPLWYVGFPSPRLHQHPVFFHKPAKSTSLQGASCFSIITAGLRLPPAPWPLPSLFFFHTLTTDALTT